MATDKQGRIVKILHNGLKHYAVVKDKVGKGVFAISFPMHMSGSVAVVTENLPVNEIRPISFSQDHPVSVLLRQLTGIPMAQHAAKQPQSATGKLKPQPAEPAQPANAAEPTLIGPANASIEDFTVMGIKIKDMPEGVEKEMAKSIAKNMKLWGSNGIEWK